MAPKVDTIGRVKVTPIQYLWFCLVGMTLNFVPASAWPQAVDPWTVPMTISLDGNGQDRVSFGTRPGATNGFDPNVDVLNPPPPPDKFDAFFQITHVFPSLSEDYRSPEAAAHDWTFRISGTSAGSGTISWDTAGFPAATPPGMLEIREGTTVLADMLSVNSLAFTGDQDLTIQYQAPPAEMCFAYNFPATTGAWYLISLPVIPSERSVTALFPGAAAAFEWNYTSQNYASAAELEPGNAYWLLVLEPAIVTVCGSPLPAYMRAYTIQGWDMIGSTVTPSPVVDDPDGCVLAMFGWDAAAQSYAFVDPFLAQPMQGYWIAVFEVPCSVAVGGNAGSNSAGKQKTGCELAVFRTDPGSQPPPPPFAYAAGRVEVTPAGTGLLQNYPNPFNPETVIAYQMANAGRVSLRIHDAMGREVRTLVDHEMPAGYHRVKWEGRNEAGGRIASGVYLCRLRIGGFVQTRKMLLLK